MELGQIEAFVAVARRHNFSRAASDLHLTQPSVTARIQALEEELREPLFERTKHGALLTEAGQAFLQYAERALNALAAGRETLASLRSGTLGKLYLGAGPAISTYFLPSVLKRFTHEHPGVEVVLRTGHSEGVLQMILEREVQLGLVRSMAHPEIESRPLYQDVLVCVVGPTHPYAAAGRASIEQVAAGPLLMFDRTSSYYEMTNALFMQAGLVRRLTMELDNIEAAKKMVEEGLGLALLPLVSVEREVSLGWLKQIEITNGPRMHRQTSVIRLKDLELTPAMSAFLDLLHEVAPPQPVAVTS